MKPYKNQPKFAQEGLHGVIDDLLFQPDLDKKNTAELTALPMAKVPGSILKALKPHHTDYIRVDPIEARYWHIGIHPHDDRQVFYFVGNKAERVKTLNYGNIKQIYAFIKKSALTTQIEADTLSGGKKAFSGGGSHGQSAAGLGTSTKKNSYFKNEGAGLDSGRGPSASQSSKRKNYPGNKKTIGKPNNSMQPVDTVAPSVIINQPKPKQVIKLEQNQATKRRFAYHQLGPGETAASVVERYTGTPNENRIYGFNYPQFTAKNPPQAGDEVRVSTGFDVLVKGQFYNSNKVFVMWNGPTTGSKTATLEQVNGEYQQDRGYDWELVLPLVGGEYTITAEAGGVTDSVSFTVDASVERMMSANNRNQQIDASAQFLADEARWASRQQGVVDNYFDARQRAYNQTVSAINAGVAAGDTVRNQLAPLSAAHTARYASGDALAAYEMDRFNYVASGPSVSEQQRWVYQQSQEMGGFGDIVQGVGEGFVDSIYQGVQFIGTSIAAISPTLQGISHLTGNGSINPLTTNYHSMFDAPTTVNQSAGRFVGEVASFAVGGEGVILAGSKLLSRGARVVPNRTTYSGDVYDPNFVGPHLQKSDWDVPTFKPQSSTYEGRIYRYEVNDPNRIESSWTAHQWNVASNHRYTQPGNGGVYAGTTEATARAEISHYGALDGRVLISQDIKQSNMLDLRKNRVRSQLNVTRGDLIDTSHNYQLTHDIGDWAKRQGYSGLLVPSARDRAGHNIILFDGL